MTKSITVFTEGYPYQLKEIFIKGELDFLSQIYDEVILVPLGMENVKPVWLKGEAKDAKVDLPRLKIMLRKHWKEMLAVLRLERKESANTTYFRRPIYHLKMILYAIKKSYELNQILPKKTVLYTYWYSNWALNISMLKKLHRPNAKWVTRVHGFDVDLQQVDSGYYPFRKWNNTQLDKVICISQYGHNLFTQDNPQYKGKVEVNYLGINKKGFAPVPKGKAYTIVSCSKVIPLKRLDKLASILAHLNRRILWVHFGDGPDMARINSYLNRLPDNIGYDFKGYTPNEEIFNYYLNNEVDLFINASKLEGIPFSMIEAASFGIPIAGFNICGIPEIVTKHMGVLMDEGMSNEENADKIKSFLLSSLGRDENYRRNIQLEINQRFNAEVNYKDFSKMIEQQS